MAWWYWAGAAAAGVAIASGWRALRGLGFDFHHETARESFRLQRERLEAKFLDAATATGKPRGLSWVDCSFEGEPILVRNHPTRQLLGLVPMTVKFAAVEGGPMEGVEAVANLRYCTGVFSFAKGQWVTEGRALFNMHPDEAIEHFAGQFQKI